ncbi:YhgE/Pip domain-containing protein [Alkalihalobacillus oceani]|uniref:YhgE/Pip domain-containing protein n=1 Tax=Halalkalibacter oceani TaxID=1653776 RepID=UPI002041437C|nr:YhgE/Pip domain-containing protein [Halalkalibacter oceani]MCM3762897.1 YhgE/Pip domain-containing protein [Halalkalibacter oceani]
MKMKRLPFVIVAVMLVAPSFLVHASPVGDEAGETGQEGEISAKEEVIYANLLADGQLDEVFVVNTLHVSEAGMITDYGRYSSLKNLTNEAEMKQSGDEVRFAASEGSAYYQGNLKDRLELPWDFSLSYELDGEEMTVDELAGANGRLQITIDTSRNEDVDPSFFENYLLQIALTFEEGTYETLETSDGVIANAGKDKQVTFTVMPGEEKELSLSAAVTDFEFSGIDITAVPPAMAIEAPGADEIAGEFSSLTAGVKEMDDGVGELKQGISQLNDGLRSLENGSAEYKKGIDEMTGSSAELVKASSTIEQALKEVSQSLQLTEEMDVGDLQQLPDGLFQLADALKETSQGLVQLREQYATAYNQVNEAMNGISGQQVSQEQIEQLYASGADRDVIDRLVEAYSAAQKAKATYEAAKQGFDAVDSILEEVSAGTKEMANRLTAIADGLNKSLSGMDGLDSFSQLQEGLSALAVNYSEFHQGLVSYTGGVGQLSAAYSELHHGIGEVTEGSGELATGADALHNGTGKLHEATSGLPEQMQEEIDAMISDYDKSDFDPVSFVSEKNHNVETVQFVIKTAGVEIEEPEEAPAEREEEKSFWTKLRELFSRE